MTIGLLRQLLQSLTNALDYLPADLAFSQAQTQRALSALDSVRSVLIEARANQSTSQPDANISSNEACLSTFMADVLGSSRSPK